MANKSKARSARRGEGESRSAVEPPTTGPGAVPAFHPFPVVGLFPLAGVRTSADGLKAFTTLLKALPADTGLAFVLIENMDPTQTNKLPRRLSTATRMPIQEAVDGMAIERNHIYVISANVGMTIENGVLRSAARTGRSGEKLPIDDFLCSLEGDLESAAAEGIFTLGRVQPAGRGTASEATASEPTTSETNQGTECIPDWTESRQAGDALRLTNERLMLAQEAAGIGIWDWDIQADRTRCSRKWGLLFGSPHGDVTSSLEDWLGLIDPEDRERVRGELTQALEGASSFSTEFRVAWPDGSVHWLLARGNVLRDDQGNPIRMLGVNVDITRRRLAEEERQALSARLATAQEDERRRISRELHDDLTQRLARLAMDLGGFAAASPASSKLKQKLQALQGEVVRAAEVARHVAYELHPSELDDLGLAAAVRSHCEDFSRQHRIAVEFTARDLPAALSREIASCLFKVIQECLRNIARHANGKQASVALEGAGDRIRLRVVDSGTGFSLPSLVTTLGLGIQSMKERVRLIHGTFAIASQPGRGTQITVEVPVPMADVRADPERAAKAKRAARATG